MNKIFGGVPKRACIFGGCTAGFLALAICVPAVHSHVGYLELTMFLLGLVMNLGWPAVSVFVSTNYPPHILGKVFAVASGLSVCCGAVVSGVAGAILNATHDYIWVYFLCLAMMLMAAALSTLMNPVKTLQRNPEAGKVVSVAR